MLKQPLATFALLAAATLVPASAATAAEGGLVGHWTFDSGSGKNAASANFNATIKSTLKTTPGVFGDAIELSPKTKTRIEVSPDALPVGIRQLTFSAWVAPTRTTKNQTLLRKEDSGRHGDNRILFAIQNGKFLTLGINCGGNYAELDAIVPADFFDGNWHLATATFDGKTMRAYVDGVEIGSFERQVPLSTVHDFAPLRVSRDAVAHSNYESFSKAANHGVPFFIASANGTEDFFNGKLDDLRFYSKALSAAEIQSLFLENKNLSNDAKLRLEKNSTANSRAWSEQFKITSLRGFLVLREQLSAYLANEEQKKWFQEESQRVANAAFPADLNAYIMKWQRSPVDLLSLDPAARRARVNELINPVGKNIAPAFEYLPITDQQWAVLSKAERAQWERAKALKEKLADADEPITAADIYELEALVNDRPSVSESVARHVAPETPATVTRTAEEARAVLEADWLFQANGKPTVTLALEEIEYTRKLAERLSIPIPAALNELETIAKTKPATAIDKALYLAVRTLKREIAFKNPVLDFDSILYIDNPHPGGRESDHETRHRLGYMAVPGGRLLVQKGLSPDGQLTQLAPTAPLHGTFWRPDLSFDATKVLFSYKPHNEKTFHIYEIGLDGTGFRQLTGGMFDDLDPIYLPDQKNILFTTTRGYIYVRCMPPTNAMVTAKLPLNAKPGDKTLYITSRNGEPEYTPSVLADGRIIYTRWEYTDKPLWRAQSLWTMNPNTTNVQTFWGNQSVWPDLLKDARSIPGSNRVMFTGSAHHNWFAGSIGIIDPTQGLNFPHGLTKVTQDIEWPECGNGPTDPKENATYHKSGNYQAYYSPYPLSEKDFLVSAKRNGKWVLLLMDTDGNRELINEGTHHIWDAQPIRKRPVPSVRPDLVDWPTWETRDKPGTGLIYSNNVYENAPPELKDKAKFLRIWSIEHKTYTYWYKRNYVSSGPEVSANQSEGVKKIIGTVPIEPDGSVAFNAPSGIALHFQLLDENQRALQTMKSFTGVQPGETRACFGCHEQKMNAPRSNKIGQAMRRTASDITPTPWKDITVGYERYVQPALDKYCASCHADATKPATKAFNSRLRPGFLGFKEPYMTLLGSPTWGRGYRSRTDLGGAFGWADTILPESFSTTDPAAYSTYPAMTRLSYKSRLVKRLAGEKVSPGDKHPVIKADPESILRVIHWVDAMGPYNGAEEIRNMEDPLFQGKAWISQPPRIHNAPIVQRPGPFDVFYTDEDPAYFPPKPEQYNALPHGVTRK